MLSGNTNIQVSQSTFWFCRWILLFVWAREMKGDHPELCACYQTWNHTCNWSARGIGFNPPRKASWGQRSPARGSTGVGDVSFQSEMWWWRRVFKIKKKVTIVSEYFYTSRIFQITKTIEHHKWEVYTVLILFIPQNNIKEHLSVRSSHISI